MAKVRERADALLFKQGLTQSKEQAKRSIMAGEVFLEGEEFHGRPVDKPGHLYPVGTRFYLRSPERFVSRGAYKLLTLLETTGLDVTGFVCLDAGASTGGFTDCLLQAGAARVYAFDVGHNQLHEKLRADPRVISREGINLRHPPPELIQEALDFICCDVSFISVTRILPACLPWLAPSGKVAVLIKPQFELGPGETVRGVVKDPAAQKRACESIVQFCAQELALHCSALMPSMIKGAKGNQEFIALFTREL